MPDAGIDKIFTPKSSSIWEFLIVNGQGCYIPAYQRSYAWDRGNITRLFEDVLYGINQIEDRPGTISFLGTIIAIHDQQYLSVEPIDRPNVAPRVMTIIDGQQRLFSLVMSNMVLHDHINQVASKIKNKDEKDSWIREQCERLCADLRKAYLIDCETPRDSICRYYPRIIRAHEDKWSRQSEQYEGPAAKLIWEYIKFTEPEPLGQGKNRFKPQEELDDHHKTVRKTFLFIQREILRICGKQPEKYDFPKLAEVLQSKEFVQGMWGFEFEIPSSVKEFVAEGGNDKHHQNFCYLMRLIIFARYLNDRVGITVVTATNEYDAFDMFEALNTTGEPLTAFETFKPKVIEAEGLSEYPKSPSYEWIEQIEKGYLNRYNKAEAKQKAVSEMLIPFALAETGEKLQNRLNIQRRYLRDQFGGLSHDEKQTFVRLLAGIASFMSDGWDPIQEEPAFTSLGLKNHDERASLGFEVLRKLKHSITIAPLYRFYQCVLDAEGAAQEKCIIEFAAAIKATVAFSVLWRGAMGGTKNIDSYYREIMSRGIENDLVPPLARRPKEKQGEFSLENYKQALRHVLEHKGSISSKDKWVESVSRVGIYEHSNVIARFLLFCASDDAVPDEKDKGLIERGRRGCSPMLRLVEWDNDAYFTVEHVAPQSESNGWQESIYKDPKTIHTLGNLILLPREVNSILGDKSWNQKKQIYKLLAAKTQDEFNEIKKGLKDVEVEISDKAEQVFDATQHLDICESVTYFDQPWSLDIIQNRTRRVAELAWDRLEPWLYS